MSDAFTYNPDVFNVNSISEAKKIILTDEGCDTDKRWELETNLLVSRLVDRFKVSEDSLVLDYGCGIGRMSKALIEATNCHILGVDLSPSMRMFSIEYVNHNNFSVISCEVFAKLIKSGLKVNMVLAIWVLQHCPNVAEIITQLAEVLVPKGQLFLVNNIYSSIPTKDGDWINDGSDILPLAYQYFEKKPPYEKIPPDCTGELLSENAFIGFLEKK